MPPKDRAAEYRKQALDAESKAFKARTEETRRAWLIIARDWNAMAERVETRGTTEATE